MVNKLAVLCLSFSVIIITTDSIKASPARFKRQWTWDAQTLRPSTSFPISSPTPITSTTTSNGFNAECHASCLRVTTNEYNPVCGSDNFTYDNPSKLKCANRCGAAVTVSFMGSCAPL